MPGPSLDLQPNYTLLVLTPLSGFATPEVTPWSARGLTQTLDLITGAGGGGTAWLRRDVNGYLRSVADDRFQKYKSVVSCRDGETPCLDGGWVGHMVEVSCTHELNFPTGGAPQRPAVAGSARVQGGFTYYRPILNMLIASINNSFQEYPGLYSWSITLEEI